MARVVGARRTRSDAVAYALAAGVLGAGSLAVLAFSPFVHSPNVGTHSSSREWSYILEGRSPTGMESWLAKHRVAARPVPGLPAVTATLSPDQAARARAHGLDVVPNKVVTMSGSFAAPPPAPPAPPAPSGPPAPPAPGPGTSSQGSDAYLQVTGANSVIAGGDKGQGVTVAVLDTGISAAGPYLGSRVIDGVNLSGSGAANSWNTDQYGHGTFVAGLIASDPPGPNPSDTGEAPAANLVSIKVAGASGVTTESTVIAGIEWAIAHQAADHIRVLNLSLGVEPVTPAAADPLDQAVEQAWKAGIVVVTTAGNVGPNNGTITSPGDDPLAITVGAVADNGNPNPSAASMTTFSSVGPTAYDGYFKPDLVAPGGSVVSLADPGSTIDTSYPSARVGANYFVGSGTSFSAAIVSGAVALLLEKDPSLTPDGVKAALLASATVSPGPVGNPFVDGHGMLDVPAALAIAGQLSLDQTGYASAGASTTPSGGAETVSLSTTWAASSWNPSNWTGPAASQLQSLVGSGPVPSVNGLNWTGAAWNGAAWNSAAWNSAAWNSAAWNSAAWNSAAWNGESWSSAAWNSAAWNGAAWNSRSWG